MADFRRTALLIGTNRLHLGVRLTSKGSGASATATICAGDPTKPRAILTIAGGDAMKGHKFQVVLVRANAEVGGARLCFGGTDLVRNKEVDIRVHR